jgi:hypothetical protein
MLAYSSHNDLQMAIGRSGSMSEHIARHHQVRKLVSHTVNEEVS